MRRTKSRKRRLPSLTVGILLLLALGCDSWDPLSPMTKIWDSPEGSAVIEESGGPVQQAKDPPSTDDGPSTVSAREDAAGSDGADGEPADGSPPDASEVPPDFSGVRWLHEDVSGWSETGTLRSVRVSGGTITLDYDRARKWRGVNHAGAFVNANPWIFVKVDGIWYAATWEWLRFGQTSKSTRSVAGDHIKKHPLANFTPRAGEVYGFMVSGLARDAARNVRERTQVLMYRWP